jgi:hypothetical protein
VTDTEKDTERLEFSGSTIELSRSIWSNLSKVNVNEHTETKNGLTYLSWAWAYGIMMEHYPGMTYRFYPTEYHNDDSATVHCSVMIRSGEDHVVRSMWLPVMDFRNKAVVNPSSVDINKAKMRCLTKCFSQFGLGHYIYAGDDTPSEPEPSDKKVSEIKPAKKQPPKQEDPAEQADPGADFNDEDSATEVADLMVNLAKTHTSSVKSLAEFWKKNKKVIDKLDNDFPEQYQRVKSAFTEMKKEISK